MKGNLIMKKSLGFTLAEVLITLAIIGVVAAMTIPSVIVNTNQAEFRTGLRKAVSVLNSALTMNTALEGESPHDNDSLFHYLQQHMSVMKSTTQLDFNSDGNYAFYTTDGMRYEFPTISKEFTIHENGQNATFNTVVPASTANGGIATVGRCGSKGLANNDMAEAADTPCLILVDVNGDRKPTPANASQKAAYSYAAPGDKLLKDIFSIMITDEKAVPLGVVAQKAMYQSQK